MQFIGSRFWRLWGPRAWCQPQACCVISGYSVKGWGWACSRNHLLGEHTHSSKTHIHPFRKAGLRIRFLSGPTYQHGLILTRTWGSPFNHAALCSKQQIFVVKVIAVSSRFSSSHNSNVIYVLIETANCPRTIESLETREWSSRKQWLTLVFDSREVCWVWCGHLCYLEEFGLERSSSNSWCLDLPHSGLETPKTNSKPVEISFMS